MERRWKIYQGNICVFKINYPLDWAVGLKLSDGRMRGSDTAVKN